jgi:cellulose synthase/poly-beta-1,6-N-acetylglucosamine synthase-like glycosyltransferase
VARALLWTSAALIAWTQVVYALFLAALRAVLPAQARAVAAPATRRVSLIVAAHREEAVIAEKVADALALDWPREQLEIVVAVDGGGDATAELARAAGADVVLELPRGGKVRAQDAGVRAASGELLVFSDANARWEPGALRALTAAFEDPAVGFACGRVSFVNEGGDNQEGVYWRYEMWLRGNESALASVTAGNGAIYAVRPEAYIEVDPVMGHDLSFPFNLVKRGWRAVDVPDARATEKMVPSLEGGWVCSRRMMSHAWPIVLRGGMLDPRGYPPLYALMVLSHRVLRYATPLLHVVAALATLALLLRGRARIAALAQLAFVGAAMAGGRVPSRPLLLARYYVLTTASLALGLYDHLRHGTPAGWDQPEGTR